MARVSWDEFFNRLYPVCPKLPAQQARNALRDAAATFCEETWIWQADADRVRVLPGLMEYDIAAPEGGSLVAGIVSVAVGETRLEAGQGFTFAPPVLSLLWPPERRAWLTCRVALKPSETSSGIPRAVHEAWAGGIAAGALASLLVMPGQAWTNPGLAQFYGAQFRESMGRAKRRLRKSFTRKPLMVHPQRFE
jgi:hypothetical protein